MAIHIDWRRQFSKLRPYLDGKGGVVNVRYRGASCGANAFLTILKSDFESRPHTAKPLGVSIRLDPANYKVRYLAGIRSEFARILNKQPLMKPMPASMFVEAETVLSNNTAGGDQHIEANFYFDGDSDRTAERNEWVSLLVSELREHLKTKRFMIVLLGGSSEDQAEFWSSIWIRVNDLTSDGLLLVRMIDDEMGDITRDLHECQYDCEVTLAPLLDGKDVEHAIEDVTALISDKVPGNDAVSNANVAKGYVLSNKHDVSALHNRLLRFIADLQEY